MAIEHPEVEVGAAYPAPPSNRVTRSLAHEMTDRKGRKRLTRTGQCGLLRQAVRPFYAGQVFPVRVATRRDAPPRCVRSSSLTLHYLGPTQGRESTVVSPTTQHKSLSIRRDPRGVGHHPDAYPFRTRQSFSK